MQRQGGSYGLLLPKRNQLDACFLFTNQATRNYENVPVPRSAYDSRPTVCGTCRGRLFFGLLFAAMYFLMIAPQRKKQKEHEKMLAALGTGDEVLTNGGIYGTITNVKEDRFVLRIADNTKVEIGKSFVSAVVNRTGGTKK